MSKSRRSRLSQERDLLEKRLGYSFYNKQLLIKALALENRGRQDSPFETLEFLGDACLRQCISKLLFERYAELGFTNANLSHMAARILRNNNLALLSHNLFMLRAASGVQPGRAYPPRIFADVFEAVIGAIDQDRGNGEVLRISSQVFAEDLVLAQFINPLRILTHLCQSRDLGEPEFRLREFTPENGPTLFRATLHLWDNSEVISEGAGVSAKLAIDNSAERALLQVQNKSNVLLVGKN